MKNFEIGDKVIVNKRVCEYSSADRHNMYEGKELTVIDTNSSILGYLLLANGDKYFGERVKLSDGKVYSCDWIDKKDFSLQDLEDGQLIETRCGATFIKFGKMIVEVSNSKFLKIGDFDEKTMKNKRSESCDIVKVFDSNDCEFIFNVHGKGSLMHEMANGDIDRYGLKKIWEVSED